MEQAYRGELGLVVRLLQDPRVRHNIHVYRGCTALHRVCEATCYERQHLVPSIMRLLLQAGSDPALKNRQGQTALDCLREELFPKPAAIAVLEQVPDAEKTSILVKARRLVSAATSTTMAPSYLQSRMARGKPLHRLLLRRMVLTPVTGGHDEDNEEDEGHKLRVLVAFILGVGGPEGKGMPRDVFWLVLSLLMPTWDP